MPGLATPAARRPLAGFVEDLARLLEEDPPEATVLSSGGELLAGLVERDGWLGDEWTAADPDRYRQNLLHADAAGRFCVVSFVWGPGQFTPVHDHTTWGLIGMLRGAEDATSFAWSDDRGLVPDGDPVRLRPGQVDAVSPTVGDIHQVRNAYDDRVSVSIHVYGTNIGTVERHVYPGGTERKRFVSGFSNPTLPNPWGPADG